MSFQQIILLLVTYKYILLFPIVVVEGPIITVIAGLLSSLGHLNIFIVYGVVVVGDLTGDTISYTLGRWGGARLIERWGHYVGLNIGHIQKFKNHFDKHTASTIIWGKLAYAMEMPFLIGAGMAKVPYRKFFLYTLIPTLPKSLLFLLIGFYFGESYSKINTYLDYTAIGTISLAILLTIVYFVMKNISKKHEEQDINNTTLS
ncbi:MAG: DedA family protein [Patescibacteria group bacterium]